MNLTGKTPSKQDAALYGTYNKIKNCPARVSSGKGKQVTLGAAFKIGDKSGTVPQEKQRSSSSCLCFVTRGKADDLVVPSLALRHNLLRCGGLRYASAEKNER